MHKSALYISAAILLLSACNKAVMESQNMGFLTLSLSSDREVVVRTKAEGNDCSDYLVDISGKTFLGQDYQSEQYVYSSMPDYLTVPYGYYYVSAQSCLESVAEQGCGCVRYQGVSNQVDVVSQTPAKVSVTCRMVNGKVTMYFDESFIEDFTDLAVSMEATRTVLLTDEQARNQTDVYFNLPAEGSRLIYTIHGTVAKGTPSEKRLSYSNSSSPLTLLPAKWAKITIKSNHNGAIGPDIIVGGDMGYDSFTEIINPEDGGTGVDGDVTYPSILVDTNLDDATVIDCVIDVY